MATNTWETTGETRQDELLPLDGPAWRLNKANLHADSQQIRLRPIVHAENTLAGDIFGKGGGLTKYPLLPET